MASLLLVKKDLTNGGIIGGTGGGVAHVAAHELGAAAYAIRTVIEAASKEKREEVRLNECFWQREGLPEKIRSLVIDDERLKNDICWFVFS